MDPIDRSIIDALRLDSRAPYGMIGDQVGLSGSAVKRRIDRLVAAGVIRSFTITVDPGVEGLGTEAYVELFCRGNVTPDALRRILGGVPEVVSAVTVTGEADALAHLRSRDMASLERALEQVRAAATVDHTRSAIVLSRLVERDGRQPPPPCSAPTEEDSLRHDLRRR